VRILLLAHAFNSLTQRIFVELREAGHLVSVEFDVNDRVTEEAVTLFRPDLVIAPYLRRAIPESVWRRHRCIVLHPGIVGDRGPSALDWAIEDREPVWGVTALQANAEMDAGDVWASVGFPMRAAAKGSLYRREVTDAAVEAVRQVLGRLADPGFRPRPLAEAEPAARGRWRPLMRQAERRIDWARDDTATVLRRIRAGDGAPGVLDELFGEPFHVYDAHLEASLRGGARPGEVVAQRDGALLRATVDGAVWITHLKRPAGASPDFKLPAAALLGGHLAGVPEAPLAPHEPAARDTWRDIRYEERGPVGTLHFAFYNGAMGVGHCQRLRDALRYARHRPTRVLVLAGGPDFWSNGLHLNLIEASEHPAEVSWRNIVAMDDLALELIAVDRQVTIAALQGNAGAGGVFLALAADRVFARDAVILNPHYKSMGNLYGSEYWTYLLPRRVGAQRAAQVTQGRLPVGTAEAARLGLIDAHFGTSPEAFLAEVAERAAELARDPAFETLLADKARRRAADEAAKPLAAYRAEELDRMQLNFFGFDPSYHVARSNFVRKVPRSRTPLYLAVHRSRGSIC
jgi:putative two-component system hydrogenase maturation factor HypX/HoxX